jgi:ribosome recycling factor
LANQRLLEERNRSLSVVRKLGYRVLRANEIVGYAKRHERKAETQVGLALNMLRYTMRSEMSDLERRVHEQYQVGLNGVYTTIRQLNDKVERTDKQVQSLQVEQHATEDTMQSFMKEMISRIERLEQGKGGE